MSNYDHIDLMPPVVKALLQSDRESRLGGFPMASSAEYRSDLAEAQYDLRRLTVENARLRTIIKDALPIVSVQADPGSICQELLERMRVALAEGGDEEVLTEPQRP